MLKTLLPVTLDWSEHKICQPGARTSRPLCPSKGMTWLFPGGCSGPLVSISQAAPFLLRTTCFMCIIPLRQAVLLGICFDLRECKHFSVLLNQWEGKQQLVFTYHENFQKLGKESWKSASISAH